MDYLRTLSSVKGIVKFLLNLDILFDNSDFHPPITLCYLSFLPCRLFHLLIGKGVVMRHKPISLFIGK